MVIKRTKAVKRLTQYTQLIKGAAMTKCGWETMRDLLDSTSSCYLLFLSSTRLAKTRDLVAHVAHVNSSFRTEAHFLYAIRYTHCLTNLLAHYHYLCHSCPKLSALTNGQNHFFNVFVTVNLPVSSQALQSKWYFYSHNMIVDVIRELSMKKQEKIAKPVYIFRLTRQIKVIYLHS